MHKDKVIKKKHIQYWNECIEKDRIRSSEKRLFHDYFREIPFRYMAKLLQKHHIDISNKKILIAGCGKGTDIYYLRKFYSPKIHVIDILKPAVEECVNAFNDIRGTVADIEQLPFNDNCFDYSFTAASLHHLSRPTLGLYELLRVSKYGIIVIEPNDSILTRMATFLGFAHAIEKTGNYVFRFAKRDVIKITRSLFFDYSLIRCFAIHKVAETRLKFFILKGLNHIANMLCSSWGNYIIFVIRKGSNRLDE